MIRFDYTLFLTAFSLLLFACAGEQETSGSTLSELSLYPGASGLFTIPENPPSIAQATTHSEPVVAAVFVELQHDYLYKVPGDTLRFYLDGETPYLALVQRVQEQVPGIETLTAAIHSPEPGHLSLVLRGDQISGTIQLYGQNRHFILSYDGASGYHLLAELDPEQLDIREGSEPMTAEPQR
ncbi:MAG: hypothetical protein ACNA78_03895 [Balneolaceae bacterium]